jgi:hypothetical protein
MSDFASSLPVRTETNGDVVVKLVDGTTNTQAAAVDASGNVQTLVNNTTLAPVNSQDAADGPVAPGTAASKAMLIAAQYNATLPTLADTQQAAVQVDASGRLLVAQAVAAVLNATVVQGAPNTIGNAWPVLPTDGTNSQSFTAAGEAKVDITQPIPAGTNLIGSVNSRTEDGAGTAITSSLINSKQRLDVDLASEGTNGAAVPFGTLQVGGTDGTDLRAISVDTSGKVNVDLHDATGAAFSSANPLPVSISSSTPGTPVQDYKDATAIAAAASDNHDYTVTAGKTLNLARIWASASGKLKVQVEVETGVATGTFVTKFVGFNSTAAPNIDITVVSVIAVAAGVRVRVVATNEDKQSMDLYSTIEGTEV